MEVAKVSEKKHRDEYYELASKYLVRVKRWIRHLVHAGCSRLSSQVPSSLLHAVLLKKAPGSADWVNE